MSGGQIVGGVVGAAIGFFIPGGGATMALRGMSLGMSIGGYLDPPKGPVVQGPRLDDLTVQTATYGSIIPRVYGTVGITGNIFWVENNALKEVETRSQSGGGKGGGGGAETSTFSYYGTFAVGLCKGPISGVRRIWISGKLIYDIGSSDQAAMRESNSASGLFTLYTGSNIQLPDSRMQATLGVANTPAYRGLAYLVFKDLPLKAYNNTIQGAQVKVEVVGLGSYNTWSFTTSTFPTTSYWRAVAWNGSVFCAVGDNIVATSPDGITWTTCSAPSQQWSDIIWNGKVFCAVSGWNKATIVSKDGKVWLSGQMPVEYGSGSVAWNGSVFCSPLTNGLNCAYSLDGITWALATLPYYAIQFNNIVWSGKNFICVGTTLIAVSPDGSNWSYIYTMPETSAYTRQCIASNGVVTVALTYVTTKGLITYDHGLTWSAVSLPVSDGWQTMNYANGMFIAGGVGGNHIVISTDGVNWTRIQPSPGGNFDFAWNGAVWVSPRMGSTNSVQIYIPLTLSVSTPQLSQIISNECLSTGLLNAGDIDVTEVTGNIRGYSIASVSAIKSSLIQLQGVFPFDVVQRGYKMKFKPRGGESVVTIPASDLGAVGESI